MAGRDLVRDVPVPTTHVRWSRKGAMRVFVMTTGLLRLLVRLLYLFPALVALKLVLFMMHVHMGDLIIVAFVELVVVIFALLAIVVLLMLVVGPRKERGKHSSLVYWPPSPSQARRLLSRGATRVTGRVEAGLEAGAEVLSEEWSSGADGFERKVSGSSFLVVPDEGTTVAVELLGCPLLLDLKALSQGDRVEIVAAEARQVIHLDDPRLDEIVRNAGPGLAPYRETESTTLVVSSTPESPVVIRRV